MIKISSLGEFGKIFKEPLSRGQRVSLASRDLPATGLGNPGGLSGAKEHDFVVVYIVRFRIASM